MTEQPEIYRAESEKASTHESQNKAKTKTPRNLGTPQERLEILQDALNNFVLAGGKAKTDVRSIDGQTILLIGIVGVHQSQNGRWELVTEVKP